MDGEDVEAFVNGDKVLIAGGEEAAAGCQGTNEGGNIYWNYFS
jgi:hypothetical protein